MHTNDIVTFYCNIALELFFSPALRVVKQKDEKTDPKLFENLMNMRRFVHIQRGRDFSFMLILHLYKACYILMFLKGFGFMYIYNRKRNHNKIRQSRWWKEKCAARRVRSKIDEEASRSGGVSLGWMTVASSRVCRTVLNALRCR